MKAIPFLTRFIQPIKMGEKTMTCRMRKYGEPGDCLYVPNLINSGIQIQILEVRHVPLGQVSEFFFAQEGCRSPEDFQNVWTQIHPKTGFDPEKMVWLHIFRLVP